MREEAARSTALNYSSSGNQSMTWQALARRPCFEAGHGRLFKRVWLQIDRVEAIANPGDYFARQIDVLDTSVIVSRGRDGVPRAFHNLCRHRGNRVVKQAAGSAKAFSCGFHGWTYNSKGALMNIPSVVDQPSQSA